jgi:hypothetical protein
MPLAAMSQHYRQFLLDLRKAKLTILVSRFFNWRVLTPGPVFCIKVTQIADFLPHGSDAFRDVVEIHPLIILS